MQMKILVRGFSPFVEEKEWLGATTWFLKYLLGQNEADRLTVHIELSRYIRGNCGSISCSNWKKPAVFLIQIETGAGKRMKHLCTLAHEIVHLKQIVRRELGHNYGILYWRPKRLTGSKGEAWEEEAYARERELYRAYQSSLHSHSL